MKQDTATMVRVGVGNVDLRVGGTLYRGVEVSGLDYGQLETGDRVGLKWKGERPYLTNLLDYRETEDGISAAVASAAVSGSTTIVESRVETIYFIDDDGSQAEADTDSELHVQSGLQIDVSASGSAILFDHAAGDGGDLHTNYAEHDQVETITAVWTWGTTNKIQLRDTGLAIYSSVDGQLDIDADTELEITAPTVQIVAATLIDLEGTTRLDTANQLQFRDTALRVYSSVDGQLDIDADTEVEITAPTLQIVAGTLISLEGTTRLSSANELQFRDTALKLYSSADGQLDMDADTELELTAPTIQLVAATVVRIDGDTQMDGDLQFIGTQTISTSADQLILAPADQIQLDPGGDEMIFSNWGAGKAFESDDYVSQTAGFSIAYGSSGGHADFRSIFANELHVQAFIADIYEAFIGAIIITKSRAKLSRNFTVPVTGAIVDVDTVADQFNLDGDQTAYIDVDDTFMVVGSTGNDGKWTVASVTLNEGQTEIVVDEDVTDATVDGTIRFQETLYVEDLEGWENTQLFAENDYVLLRVIDTSGGGLIVADVWGAVTDYTDLAGGEQSHLFTVTDDGSVPGNSVYRGAIALDYGQSGSGSQGVWEATVLDAAGAPYSQVKTWATNPWTAGNWTARVRLGNLDGISGIGLEYGLWAGQGTGNDDAYLVLSDSSADLHNIPLTIHDGVNTRIYLNPSTPYLSVGSTAPTDYLTGDGFWVGNDAGTYKMHLGDTDGERLQWDGTDLYIYSAAGDYIWLDAGDGIKMYHNSSIGFHATAAGQLLVGNAAAGNYPKLYYDGTDLYIQGSASERIMLDANDGVKIYGNNTLTLHAKTTGVLQVGNVAGHPKFNYDGTDVYITSSANDYIWLDADDGIKIYSNSIRTVHLDNNGDFIFGQVATDKANLFWDQSEGQLNFRGGTDGTEVELYLTSGGVLSAGSGAVRLDSGGLAFDSETALAATCEWVNGATVYAKIGAIHDAGPTYHSLWTYLPSVASQNSIYWVDIDAPASYDAQLHMSASGGLGTGTLSMQDESGTYTVSLVSSELLELQSGGSDYIALLGGPTKATYDIRIGSSGGLYVGGDVDVDSGDVWCTGEISTDGGTTKFDMQGYTAGSPTADGWLTFVVNGSTYRILAEAV